ncbi:hypothetical protein HA44_16830 [Mixta gaviniae]|nr:hypothetical protein HA44_16830 [Mixta gaviniae]
MAGYYYKLINADNRRATIGLNSMLWHYQKDLSDYAFGQGGYYSPQQYFSLAVPVSYRQRTEIGHSIWAVRSPGHVRKPVGKNVIRSGPAFSPPRATLPPTAAAAASAIRCARRSSGASLRTGRSAWRWISSRRRITPPSHGLIYARYSLAGWEGDLNLPPEPLAPYADFK